MMLVASAADLPFLTLLCSVVSVSVLLMHIALLSLVIYVSVNIVELAAHVIDACGILAYW